MDHTMATTASTLQVSGLGKQKLATLRDQAKAHGLSAEAYARQLIEEGMSLERRARTESFDELFAPVQARFRSSGMTEPELDELVDRAKSRRPQRAGGKKG